VDFEIFLSKKMKNYYFSENSGLQNELNIACPKNDLITVFVAQSTDLPIKNGVIVIMVIIAPHVSGGHIDDSPMRNTPLRFKVNNNIK